MLIWVDWALIAIIFLSVVVGLLRGLILEVFSIVIWVLAIGLAFRFSGIAASWVSAWVTIPEAQVLIGFVGILVVTLMVGGLAVWLIGKLVNSTGLSGTDRMLGLLFGLVRGVIIIVLILLISRFTPFPQSDWWKNSVLVPHFEQVAEYSIKWLPEKLQKLLEQDTPDVEQEDQGSSDTETEDALDNQTEDFETTT